MDKNLQNALSEPYYEPPQAGTGLDHNAGYKSINTENLNNYISFYSIQIADNFDATHPLVMPFRIPTEGTVIVSVTMDLYFQKFRSYAINLPHSHNVSVAGHNHNVSFSDHTHVVSIGNHQHTIANHTHTENGHSHTVGGASHSHTITFQSGTDPGFPGIGYVIAFNTAANPGVYSLVTSGAGSSTGNKTINTSDATTPGNVTSFSSGTLTSNSGGTSTSDAGGSASPSSGAGGVTTGTTNSAGTTINSTDSASGLQYGIFEDTYPTAVNVIVDSNNISTALGGTWSPDVTPSLRTIYGLNMTPFVINNSQNNGIHTLQLQTNQNGRAIVELYIKCIIKN